MAKVQKKNSLIYWHVTDLNLDLSKWKLLGFLSSNVLGVVCMRCLHARSHKPEDNEAPFPWKRSQRSHESPATSSDTQHFHSGGMVTTEAPLDSNQKMRKKTHSMTHPGWMPFQLSARLMDQSALNFATSRLRPALFSDTASNFWNVYSKKRNRSLLKLVSHTTLYGDGLTASTATAILKTSGLRWSSCITPGSPIEQQC